MCCHTFLQPLHSFSLSRTPLLPVLSTFSWFGQIAPRTMLKFQHNGKLSGACISNRDIFIVCSFIFHLSPVMISLQWATQIQTSKTNGIQPINPLFRHENRKIPNAAQQLHYYLAHIKNRFLLVAWKKWHMRSNFIMWPKFVGLHGFGFFFLQLTCNFSLFFLATFKCD